MKRILAPVLLWMLPFSSFAQDWKTYPYEPEGSRVIFPRDEGRHSAEPEEWWYTTGHVTGETTGNHYSYMLSYFYHPELVFDGFRILNISNDATGEFLNATEALNYPFLSEEGLNIQAAIFLGGMESWKNKTDTQGNPIPFEYQISASGNPGSLDLEYISWKRPLIIADSGYLYQGDNFYTYYYSLTGIDVTGTITFQGNTEQVTGKAWIDRQYGSVNPNNGNQYEWFSVRLSNGMDMNIWNIFTSDDRVPEGERFNILAVYKDENTQYTTADFDLERLEYAYMPDSGMCYAQKWRVRSETDNIDVMISTLHPGHEVQLPFRFYEGPTEIEGTVNGVSVTGQGFAELLHSYEPPDVTIINETVWNSSVPFSWRLNNPDDGRPVQYSLEYSTDNNVYLPLAESITGTSFTWEDPPFEQDQEFQVRLNAASIDKTLAGEAYHSYTYKERGTGISKDLKDGIRIYPNPAGETLYISGEGIQGIRIFDLKGKLTFSSDLSGNSHEIDISKLEKGVYIVKINTSRGAFIQQIVVL